MYLKIETISHLLEIYRLWDNLALENLAPDNLAPDNLALGNLAPRVKRTIWHQELKTDNLAPGVKNGQFGTRTIWLQMFKNGQYGIRAI